MSLRPATVARIEAAHRFGAIYRGTLASHLPMALVALDRMGADDERIRRFAEAQEAKLEPIPPPRVAIRPGDEDRFLGVAEAFPAWVDYFAARMAAEGAHALLDHWADRFAKAPASGAFHGLIRTAYALESGSERELAHALAYWAAVFEPLGEPPAAEGNAGADEILAAIARDPAHAGDRPPGRNIAERTRNAATGPRFRALAGRIDPGQLRVDAIAAALIAAYCASGNFTVLHAVTGCHAWRSLAPFLRSGREALAGLWQAVLAAYLGAGSPPVEGWALAASDSLGWPEIHRRACACDDEHDVKFAYSCWREWQCYGDDLYRRAASARVCAATRQAPAC